jgi:ABC-type uncharacterized transport system substrate-binding protein
MDRCGFRLHTDGHRPKFHAVARESEAGREDLMRYYVGGDLASLIARKQSVGRRAVLIGLVTTLLPSPAHAQKSATPPRIGWLSAGSEPDPFLEGFREGLRKVGYVEGQNITLEIRHAHGNVEALRVGATELAQAKVVLIVASLTAVRAARAIKDIPILFVISGDPVEAGLTKSLSRPDANLTGSTFLSLDVAGKRVELLQQALPRLRALAVLSNTEHPGEKSELRATETAAQALGIKLIYVAFSQSPFGESPELDKALATVRQAQPDAMVVFPEGATMRTASLWPSSPSNIDFRRCSAGASMPTRAG